VGDIGDFEVETCKKNNMPKGPIEGMEALGVSKLSQALESI
jgi:hypothetical protein